MAFSCLKVVLLLFLLLEPIVSSLFALEFITGLYLFSLMILLVSMVEFAAKVYVKYF